MTISLQANQANVATNAATCATSVNPTIANTIVIVQVTCSRTNAQGSYASTQAPTAAGVTFVQRGVDVQVRGGTSNAYVTQGIWWCYYAGSTNLSITVNASATCDLLYALVSAWTGFTGTGYHTAPFDSNASLPKTATGASGTAPTVTGLSTTAASGALVAFLGEDGTINAGSAPTGFTDIEHSNDTNTNTVEVYGSYKVFSSAQSSISAAHTANAGGGWTFIVDALDTAGGSVPPVYPGLFNMPLPF